MRKSLVFVVLALATPAVLAGVSVHRTTAGTQRRRRDFIDHQTLSFDAYVKFIEDDFLGGRRLDPRTDGRRDPWPDVRENEPILGTLVRDFDGAPKPRPQLILDPDPHTDLR